MKDEWNNECPYDFKNIMFKRWAVVGFGEEFAGSDNLKETLLYSAENNRFRVGCKDAQGNIFPQNCILDEENYAYYYTFSRIDNDSIKDYSIKIELTNEELEIIKAYTDSTLFVAHENVINANYSEQVESMIITTTSYIKKIKLNSIVFNNVFNLNNQNFELSRFTDCYSNTFKNNCSFNTFVGNCNSNTFGSHCNFNTFGYSYYSNTFGSYCSFNTFGNVCYYNTFGNDCKFNTLDFMTQSSIFENDCKYNVIGINSYANMFGYNCRYNQISPYTQRIRLENNNWNVKLTSSNEGDAFNRIQNVTIRQGVSGSLVFQLVLTVERNLGYSTTFVAKGSVETEVEV
jgi:hypothetical protein